MPPNGEPAVQPGSAARFRLGFASHPGRSRERNEDAYAVWLPVGDAARGSAVDVLVAIADGMGGHEAGDVASRTAAEAVRSAFAGPDAGLPAGPDGLPARLGELVRVVNGLLIEAGRARQIGHGMGCTLTTAALLGTRLFVAHVGDSRCYRMRRGRLTQLTQDHSWVAEQQRAGRLSDAEVRSHPRRNVLTRCLGMDPGVEADLITDTVEPGDRLLLCSDGLHGPLDDATIEAVLDSHAHPQKAAELLVAEANARGGPDNITVILLDVDTDAPHASAVCAAHSPELADTQPIERPSAARRGTFPRALALATAFGALGAAAGHVWMGGSARRGGADPRGPPARDASEAGAAASIDGGPGSSSPTRADADAAGAQPANALNEAPP
jgi:serine/threonine protein phosphatase PrpC